MPERYPKKRIFNFGRIRIALWIGWNPKRYKFGYRLDNPGAWSVGFGFGIMTYLLRGYQLKRAGRP